MKENRNEWYWTSERVLNQKMWQYTLVRGVKAKTNITNGHKQGIGGHLCKNTLSVQNAQGSKRLSRYATHCMQTKENSF